MHAEHWTCSIFKCQFMIFSLVSSSIFCNYYSHVPIRFIHNIYELFMFSQTHDSQPSLD